MLNEALIVGIVVAILCGAACIYLYYCINYIEKKMGMMESILVDVRMTIDSLLAEDRHQPVPISSAMPPPMPANTTFTSPEPLQAQETENVADEKFYSSVLEQAHDGAGEDGSGGGNTGGGSFTLDQALQNFTGVEQGLGGSNIEGSMGTMILPDDGADADGSSKAANMKYDTMTRSELFNLAEQRGLRAKKSSSRSDLLNVLRRADSLQNSGVTTGTENVSAEPTGSLFPSAGALDGSFPVDLGQAGDGGASLE